MSEPKSLLERIRQVFPTATAVVEQRDSPPQIYVNGVRTSAKLLDLSLAPPECAQEIEDEAFRMIAEHMLFEEWAHANEHLLTPEFKAGKWWESNVVQQYVADRLHRGF
jgi:hypothetical protein